MFAAVLTSILIEPAQSLWSKNLVINGSVDVKIPAQGCSPGYWKQEQHKTSWDAMAPDYTAAIQWFDPFNETFAVAALASLLDNTATLFDAVNLKNEDYPGSSQLGNLIFHAVAALANADANAAGNLTGYPFTVNQVKQIFQNALAAGTTSAYNAAKQQFEDAEDDEDIECPLGTLQNGSPITQQSSGVQSFGASSLATTEVLPPIPSQCAGMTFDIVFILSEPRTFHGGPGRDLIFGSSGDDVITGGNGADCIAGGGGNDVIDAGAGDNVVLGQDGNDKVDGGPNKDKLYGGNGNDRIRGFEGDDTIDGASGTDLCEGGAGTNTVTACEKPTGPSGLNVTFVQPATARLSWNSATGAKSYNVYRSTVSGGGPTGYAKIAGPTTAAYDNANLAPGTYYYVVTWVDADGFESASSVQDSIVIVAPTATPSATPSLTPTRTPTGVPPTATRTPTRTPTATPTP